MDIPLIIQTNQLSLVQTIYSNKPKKLIQCKAHTMYAIQGKIQTESLIHLVKLVCIKYTNKLF